MNIFKTSLLIITVTYLLLSCSKDDIGNVNLENENVNLIDLNLASETDWVIANEIAVLINDHRTSMGLSKIKTDTQYATAYAVEHTKYMIKVNNVNHDGFFTRSTALKKVGAKSVGENVAFGYSTAQSVVNAWLRSPSHKKIIEGFFSHSGFGIIKNKAGKYYFTLLFYRK